MSEQEQLEKTVNDIFQAIKKAGQIEVMIPVLKKANKKLKSGKIIAPSIVDDDIYQDDFAIDLKEIF
jgi:hypothetical protein